MIIVPPEASLGHWQNVLEISHLMSLLPYATSRCDRGVWSLLCDILQISAQLKHLFTFRDSMGWLPFCLFTVKKWCFMGLHVAPEVRWIETHFCCSLSCWQMAFPSHPPAFPSCHLSFWRGHWFPRVLRFFYRRDVSPALSLCTCSANKSQLHGCQLHGHQPEATSIGCFAPYLSTSPSGEAGTQFDNHKIVFLHSQGDFQWKSHATGLM